MPRPAIRIRDFGGARSGLIFLHNREVNDEIPVLGNNLELDTIHFDLFVVNVSLINGCINKIFKRINLGKKTIAVLSNYF